MFWMRNEEIIFQYTLLSGGLFIDLESLDSRKSSEWLWFPNILGSYGNNVFFLFFRSSNHDSHRVYGQWLFRYFSQGKYFSSLLDFIGKLECKV